MKRKYLLLPAVLITINSIVLNAQTSSQQTIFFHPLFGNSELKLNGNYYPLNSSDSVQITTLKFYISAIELLNNEKSVWKEVNSFHLLDAENEKSLLLSLNCPSDIVFNKIKFNVGIDSLTNVSGAIGGDLDPTKGMYWTWQNGYVNFKLEGKSNLCQTRNNEFQFHLGGYQYPFQTVQPITLNVRQSEKIKIIADVMKFIYAADLTKQNKIMSPGNEAVHLSEILTQIFSIQYK